MTDIVNSASRSRMMSGIRGKNTKPELLLRKALTSLGYRYRLHRKDLPGAPDVVMPARKVAIFAHGCFWHMHLGCRFATLPTTRPEFWSAKLRGNVERDQKAMEALRLMGWRTLVVWECGTKGVTAQQGLAKALAEWIEGNEPYCEIESVPSGACSANAVH